jgi:alginate O-acetyltransferase complex protein AlgJ
MAVENGLRRTALSREEIARIEVGHTTVRPATARALVGVFLILISIPALTDVAVNGWRRNGATDAWSTLAALPGRVRAAIAEQNAAGLKTRIVAANRVVLEGLHGFEDDLADQSPIFAAVRPPAQSLLSGTFGVGNERVYQGRDGWLFYRADVEYVIGAGFLDAGGMRRRVESDREWIDQPQPDPRPALVEFKRQLEQRGIALVVMPTPVKPAMHPEKLAGARAWTIPVQNPSYRAFLEDLRRSNVRVFDVADELARDSGAATGYLATDTHWRPETVERAAELLGNFIREEVSLADAPSEQYQVEPREITNVGDIATMLDLPEGHRLNRPESVTIHRVLDADGQPWRPVRSADVLVLGDSFANIFSLASLGWGDSAGLIEHLARVLDRPVDRIVQNDDGAYATRERLRQDMASGSDRLRDKRVVVLQFAARELASGDWKRIELPATP